MSHAPGRARGRPFISTRPKFLTSSSRDGQRRHVKIIQAGSIATGDPRIVVGGRLACSSSGTPARIFAIGETLTRCAIVRAPHLVVDTDDVSQANADGLLLEVLETTLPRKKSLGSMPFLNR